MKQHPPSLSESIALYCAAVAKGDLPRAYRGILASLSQFKTAWEQAHPTERAGTLYQGYLDMSFVSISPAALQENRLKVSLVFLHAEGVFCLWLTAANRALQKKVWTALKQIPLGDYRLTQLQPGVDSIIAQEIAGPYAFDTPHEFSSYLLAKTEEFASDMILLIKQIS